MGGMKTVVAEKNLIAFCGFYCGACGAYLKQKCPGCRENAKAGWCKIRACNLENNYQSCAELGPQSLHCHDQGKRPGRFCAIYGGEQAAEHTAVEGERFYWDLT
jgi:hypothetical protein